MDGEEELVDDLAAQPHGINFVQALKEIATGNPDLVSRQDYLSRLKICDECPKKVRAVNVCGVCKCIIPLKARFRRASCPENKW